MTAWQLKKWLNRVSSTWMTIKEDEEEDDDDDASRKDLLLVIQSVTLRSSRDRLLNRQNFKSDTRVVSDLWRRRRRRRRQTDTDTPTSVRLTVSPPDCPVSKVTATGQSLQQKQNGQAFIRSGTLRQRNRKEKRIITAKTRIRISFSFTFWSCSLSLCFCDIVSDDDDDGGV